MTGGQFGNVLYSLLNNYIYSIKENEQYVYVPSSKFTRHILSKEVLDAFNLSDRYVYSNYDKIAEQAIFVIEKPGSPYFAGFNVDFTEDELNSFIESVLLPSPAFKQYSLVEDRVSLHVRGGDFLIFPNLYFDAERYLCIALQYFKNMGISELDVYSDDFSHARNFDGIFRKFNFNVVYKEGNTFIEDFVSLSCYRNKILWNSTFGYWTGYISNFLFKQENYDRIVVPEFHIKSMNHGKAWQINPKWKIIRQD